MAVALALAGALSWTGLSLPAEGATTPAGRLSGRVLHANGAAMPGATVSTGSLSAQADGSGNFSLSAPQGDYDLSVSAPGRQGRMSDVTIGADSKLTVVLANAPAEQTPGPDQATLSGTLRDRSGRALAGSISLTELTSPWRSYWTPVGQDGSFSLPAVKAHFRLSLSLSNSSSPDRYSSLNLYVEDFDLTSNRRVDFTVPVTAVTIVVRTPNGSAVPDAQVYAAGPDQPGTIGPGIAARTNWSGSGKTDSTGRIVLPGLPTQSLQVSAQPAGRSYGAAYLTGQVANDDTTIQLTVPAAVTLRGTMTDYDGTPVAGTRVQLGGQANISAETVTGSDGGYELNVAPGSYDLRLFKNSQYTSEAPNQYFSGYQSIQINGDLTQDIRIPGIQVPVHVADPSGAPVANAAVTAYNSFPSATVQFFPGPAGRGLRGGSVLTDAEGNAMLTVFDGEDAMVSAAAPAGSDLAGSGSRTVTLTPSSNLSFALTSTVALSGVIRATPASGFTVTVNGTPSGIAPSKTTSSDGAFNLRLAPASYSLAISSNGIKPGRPEHFNMNTAPFGLTADRSVELTPGFVPVTVKAYGASGAALALDRVPYGVNYPHSLVDLPLGSGIRATYAYFDGNGVAQSATSSKLYVLPTVPFFIRALLENGDPEISTKGLVMTSATDVALVMTAALADGSGPTTTTTTTPGSANHPTTPPVSGNPAGGGDSPRGVGRSGYWALGSDGKVYAFGDAPALGGPVSLGPATAVHLEPTPSGGGYWVIDTQGRVYPYGDAADFGRADTAKLDKSETVTSLSATPTGKGYWIFTTRGRVLPVGDAGFLGDMAQIRLNAPVVSSQPTRSGQGYYMVAADGGIFTFGDATFHGSMGGTRLNSPVRSLVPDPDGTGYWLVAGDGGIFAFQAGFRGSLGGVRLNRPVSGMVPYGNGYLMVAEDGGVFNFSDRPFSGSLGGNPPAHPVISVGVLPGA
jgi:hypothetical protein